DEKPGILELDGNPLEKRGTPEDEKRLAQCILTIRFSAAKSYWQVTGDVAAVLPVVSFVLDSRYSWVRLLAANLLGEMGPEAEEAVPSLTAALLSTNTQLQHNAAIALGKIGSTSHGVVAALVELLAEDEDYQSRSAAAKALGMLGPKAKEAVPALARAMADRAHGVRCDAAEAMEKMGPAAAGAVGDVVRMLEHEEYGIRRSAAKVLGSIGGGAKAAIPELTDLLEDPEPMVRKAAAAALDRIRKAPPARRAEVDERFRRIVFEVTVPLGEEAPFVAAVEHLVAFGSGHEVRVVDVRTGETVHRRSVVPGEGKRSSAHEARVLGIADGTIYACVRHFADPDRPDPGGGVMAIGGGPEPGSYELVAFDVAGPKVRQIGPLPSTAGLADALLGTCLVYTEGEVLQIVSLTGDAGSRFDLPGQALLRPVVRDDEVFGRYEGGLYVFHEGDRELTLVRFRDTPLERLTLEDHVEKSGDLVVACVGGDTVACDLSGKLRWRVPLDGRVVTGPDGEICVFGTTVCRLAAEDGRVIWRRYRAPDRFYWGARATFDGRLVAFGKTELSVYDLETGRLLLGLRQHRDLVRTAYNIFISLFRMTSTGNALVVGFEDRVIGIDATPVSEVPAGSRATDPANALSQLELLSKLPTQRLRRAQRLAGIGRNIADTPGASSEILPLVRELIWKEDGSPDETVVSAFHWLDDDVVLRAMEGLVENEECAEWKRIQVLGMLACRPETERA
ncbi:MAG: HEAT repeat domain-containing protein, partial [Planctomycetota bacterium]